MRKTCPRDVYDVSWAVSTKFYTINTYLAHESATTYRHNSSRLTFYNPFDFFLIFNDLQWSTFNSNFMTIRFQHLFMKNTQYAIITFKIPQCYNSALGRSIILSKSLGQLYPYPWLPNLMSNLTNAWFQSNQHLASCLLVAIRKRIEVKTSLMSFVVLAQIPLLPEMVSRFLSTPQMILILERLLQRRRNLD